MTFATTLLQIPERFNSLGLHELLKFTAALHASDPRDHIFALEGLPSRRLAQLLDINYKRSPEEIFARTTAFCLNPEPTTFDGLLSSFPFMVESMPGYRGPSWVMDFSSGHSPWLGDGSRESLDGAERYFEQALQGAANAWGKMEMGKGDRERPCLFACPKTLIGSGLFVDTIHVAAKIPGVMSRIEDGHEIETDREAFLSWLRGLIDSPSSLVDGAMRPDGSSTSSSSQHNHRFRLPGRSVSRFLRKMSKTQISEESRVKVVTEAAKAADILELLSLGNKDIDTDLPGGITPTMGILLDSKSLHYFITELGLVGITAAPVQVGDKLTIIHGLYRFMVLRKVNLAKHTEKHLGARYHIVARALVGGLMKGEGYELAKKLASLYQQLRIV
jgi:hypothetical protein